MFGILCAFQSQATMLFLSYEPVVCPLYLKLMLKLHKLLAVILKYGDVQT